MQQFVKQQQENTFVSLLLEKGNLSSTKTGSNVGIDLGLENFAILSTGDKVGNEKFLR